MSNSTRIHTWFNIRPGEERPTALMLLHSFFMGISTVFFETAASALFLAQFDASSLPFVYLAAAAVSILTGLTFTRLKDRVAFSTLMAGTLGSLLLLVCLTRLGLSAFEAGWLVFSMMVAYRLVSILTDLEYWALAARLYDVQQSKRLYSLIGSGEVTARILGAFSVPVLVTLVGVSNLLWLSALGLAGCVVLFLVIVKSFPEVSSRGGSDEKSESTQAVRKSTFRTMLGNRYLQLIFLLTLFAVLGKYFVDFAFLTQMQTRLHAVESLASFFGVFSGVTQVLNLLIRVLVSGRLLSRFGVGVGLLVLPVAHILCTLAIASVASVPAAMFWLVISNQGLYKTLKHPIDNPSFKILYQPLPRRERLAAQISVEVIVTPIAIAIAAVLMLVFSALATTAPAAFAYLMLANFVAWGTTAIFTFREYGAALVRALEKRTLDRASFEIEDEKSIALIRSKLTSEYPEDVIFALDLLQRVDSGSLPKHWADLLSHPSDDVRRYVLLQIETSRPDSLATEVGRLVSQEEVARVKAAALRALAALGDPNTQVAAHLRDSDRTVERGALIGLMQAGSDDAAKAQQRLEELVVSADARDRVLACKVLSETEWHETSSMLQSLLADDDIAVRRAALRTAGKRGDATVLSRVIEQLDAPHYRSDATRALLESGKVAAPLIAEALVEPNLPGPVRARIARIAGRLESFDRTGELWRAYESTDEHVRQEALRALSARGYSQPEGEPETIVRRIRAEIAEGAWELGLLRDLGADSEFDALRESLTDEVEQNRERVLLLLSFLYDARTMLSARDHLKSSSKEKRAYAAEILEVTLSQELKELTLPILENLSLSERLERLERGFPQKRKSKLELLVALLAPNEGKIRSWTKACAIYGAAQSSTEGLTEELARLSSDPSPLVAETSQWALQSNGDSNGSHGMLTIEKVILLKGVGMFAATSEDILADVATILEEVELNGGELVFEKGEQGDSMYIIINGRVRVFDGDKTINFLGEREIFGELALLDPEPRSAGVEAVEETRLFRLDRNTLFELMADNIGVVSGIMQVLCQRLRRMTAIATGDN